MKHLMRENIATFKTSDIQNLSERSVRFTNSTSRLGSPGTYERTFRELRKNGNIAVIKYKYRNPGQRQWSWYLQNIGEYNETS
jgi:hypothetical protein